MRALLIGSVEGSRVALDALLASSDWHLAAVATLPPSLAARHSDFVDLTAHAGAVGLPLLHVANINAPSFVEEIEALAVDAVFVIGWSQLCGPAFRAAAKHRVYGYHPAPLPRLRGRAVIPWTILLDEKITASTLFHIAEGMDDGRIIAQRYFHVSPDETAASLYAKHMNALADLLDKSLPALAADPAMGEEQDEACATWAARRRQEDGELDWTDPVTKIHRLIRAVGRPYPGAFTHDGDGQLTIWSAAPVLGGSFHHATPGQVIASDGAGFTVCCGDGEALQVVEYISASGKAPARHVLLGRRS